MRPGRADSWVTLVSGLPRSGTSMMMQMLEAGGMPLLADGVRPPDPDNPRGYFEYSPVKALPRDRTWLGAARGRAVKVVLGLLHHLPMEHRYRLILMRRNLAEVLASQRAMLLRLGDLSPRPDQDERLGRVYAAQLEEVEAWALARCNLRLLRVEHDQLLRDASSVARSVNAFCLEDLDVKAMARCVDPSLYRQRRAGGLSG